MLIFKLLHILSMFAAVTILVGFDLAIALPIWRRDVHGVATIFRMARRASPTNIGLAFLAAGIGFGLLTAATGGLDFLAGWLIAAYVLIALLILVNASPPKRKIRQVVVDAVEADDGRRSAEEVERQMATAPLTVFVGMNVVLFVAIIADMVLKPF
ncbi:MAG TPA: hypothetical protein VFH90_05540 [Candidatus Limnocylindria bacterium]|nr:hypothetical protein [Candidatus Limnocylindria bacterium]